MEKRLLVLDRVRRPPPEGWSWIDRRFVREHVSALSQRATLLYFFLAAVSDRNGLSFYGDATTALRLRLTEAQLVDARAELVARDLVAHQPPLTQVLSVPDRRIARGGRDAELVGDLLRRLKEGSR